MVRLRNEARRGSAAPGDAQRGTAGPTRPPARRPALALATTVAAALALLAPSTAATAAVAAPAPTGTAAAAPGVAANPVAVSASGGTTLSPDGRRAYVLGQDSAGGVLTVLDTSSVPRVLHTVRVGANPVSYAVSRTTGTVYVLNGYSHTDGGGGAIEIVDPVAGQVTRTVGDIQADSMGMSPDGRQIALIFSDYQDIPGELTLFDTATAEVLPGYVALSIHPYGPQFTPDGTKLYIASTGNSISDPGQGVDVVDVAARRVVHHIETSREIDEYGQLVMDPAGGRLLYRLGTQVRTIDTATDTIRPGSATVTGALRFDRAHHLYAADPTGYQVLDATTFQPLAPHAVFPMEAATFNVDDAGNRLSAATQGGGAVAVTDPSAYAVTPTSFPRRVVVGGRLTRLDVTVSLGQPTGSVDVTLLSRATSKASATTVLAGTGTTRTGAAVLDAGRLTAWGLHDWAASSGGAATLLTTAPADVRARSLLGMAATRAGDRVTVQGSAKAYQSVRDTYVAWAGRSVELQRWTSTGWQTIATSTADRLGHVAFVRVIPFRVGLRLVDDDDARIWGATSNQLVR